MPETGTRITAEELLKLPDDGKRRELVVGELREMAPAGAHTTRRSARRILGPRGRGGVANDTAAEVQSKVQMWLEAGVRLVWVVYPGTNSVVVLKSLKEAATLTATDILTGNDVVPGFECLVAEIFE